MMANVSFEVQVYAKLFLHAAKYPSEIIFGFLLGHSLQEGRVIKKYCMKFFNVEFIKRSVLRL